MMQEQRVEARATSCGADLESAKISQHVSSLLYVWSRTQHKQVFCINLSGRVSTRPWSTVFTVANPKELELPLSQIGWWVQRWVAIAGLLLASASVCFPGLHAYFFREFLPHHLELKFVSFSASPDDLRTASALWWWKTHLSSPIGIKTVKPDVCSLGSE